MIRKRFGRAATVLMSAALLGAMVVAAPVSAAQPGWQINNVQKLPAIVADGALAGYSFTIRNNGKSNISQLFLTDSVVAAPEYFWNERGTVCQTTPDLRCSFGALVAGDEIDVVIAYRVGTTNFSNEFRLDTTGDPAGGNNSHGDTLTKSVTTTVTTSPDFDGGFVVNDLLWETSGVLGRQNKQISSAEVGDTLIPVTLEDGIANFACNNSDPDCSRLIGEWSVLDVNGGTNTAPIKVTLLVWGGSVPGGAGTNDIFLVHADGTGNATAVTADCNAPTPTNADCIESVTKIGSNFKIVAWLAHNGGVRGGY